MTDTIALKIRELLSTLATLWDWIPLEQVEQVAAALREAIATAPLAGAELRLGRTGAVVVSQRALDDYQRQTGLPAEESRRELTATLLDAKRIATGDRDTGERWRVRKNGGVDVAATVAREGRLAIVTSIGTVRRDTTTPEKRRRIVK